MLKKHRVWMLGVFLLASCTSLYAQGVQGGRMVHLGDAHVDGAIDHDTIRVGRSEGKYRAIQLRVSGGAIRFDRVIVRYGNGTQEEIAIRDLIPSGGRTRIIDLPGDRRIIRTLDLWYEKATWRRRPKVSLYGVQ
jgi:hypothetical protein